MTTKLTLWAMLCTVVLAGLFSGCQSSKIAYGNSYYFKQTPKPVAEKSKIAEVAPLSSELQVANEQLALAQRDPNALLQQAQQQLLAAVEKSDNEQLKERVLRMNRMADEMKGQTMTKKEVRAKRKGLRKELRGLAKEYRNMSPNETNDLDRDLKIALILLGVSLVLFILGVVSGIFAVLGLLSLIASIVFFVIWLVNEA